MQSVDSNTTTLGLLNNTALTSDQGGKNNSIDVNDQSKLSNPEQNSTHLIMRRLIKYNTKMMNNKSVLTEENSQEGATNRSQIKDKPKAPDDPNASVNIGPNIAMNSPTSHKEQTPKAGNSFLLKFFLRKPQKQQTNEEDDFVDDIDFELENVLIKFPFLVVSPYGMFKKTWDFIMVLITVYIGFILPVRLCFISVPAPFIQNYDYESDDIWFPADILIDLLLIFDIFVNMFSAFENEAGFLVYARTAIAKEYLRGWFLVDLISVFPINKQILSLHNMNLNNNDYNFENYQIWRIIRLIKLVRMIKLNTMIEKLFTLMTLDLDKVSITKSLCSILLFVHVTACIWNLQGELQIRSSWYLIYPDVMNINIMSRYLVSLYFSLTILLTIGYGDIYAYTFYEQCLVIVWMFISIVVYAYIISSLTNSFAKMNQAKSESEEKDFFFRHWAKIFHLPYETLEMILMTIDTKSSSNSAKNIMLLNSVKETLNTLPRGLYTEIYNFFFREILEKVDFFQRQPKHFLIKLMPLLRQTNFSRGDVIYRYGDPSLEIFFIVKGRIISKCQDIYGKERTQVYVEGSLFGEVDIIMKRSRTASMRAEGDTELWKINKKEFLALLDEFPEIKEEVHRLVRIKECFRTPSGPIYQKKTPLTHLKSNYYFQQIDPYASTDIFSALSQKMRKKIKKGVYERVQDKKEYDSLDFEPDLPSPDRVPGKKHLEVLPEADWAEWEKDVTKRLVRKAVRNDKKKFDENEILEKLSAREKVLNSGVKQKILQKLSEKVSTPMMGRRGSVPAALNLMAKPQDYSLDKKPVTMDWEIQYRAKKRLLDEFKSSGKYDLIDTGDIDKIIFGDEKIQNTVQQFLDREKHLFDEIDDMIHYAEGVLSNLECYEESI